MRHKFSVFFEGVAMDAFDIAKLVSNDVASSSLCMGYAVISSIGENGSLAGTPDGCAVDVPLVRCCNPQVGDRVVVLKSGTEWLAVGVIGGETKDEVEVCPYEIGDVLVTFSSANPSSRWDGTEWQQIKDCFLLASGKRSVGDTGGEETHKLTVSEIPSHSHNWYGYDNATAGGSRKHLISGSDYAGKTGSTGGGSAHNNMPPYQVVYMWRRVS